MRELLQVPVGSYNLWRLRTVSRWPHWGSGSGTATLLTILHKAKSTGLVLEGVF